MDTENNKSIISLEEIKNDFTKIVEKSEEFLTNASKLISDGSSICSEFHEELLVLAADNNSGIGYLVSLEKIKDVFMEVISEEDLAILDFIEEKIPELHDKILKFKNSSVENDPLNLKTELLLLSEPDTIDELISIETKEIDSEVNVEEDIDKAFSVKYKASLSDIDIEDVIIAKSKKDAVQAIVEKIINELNIEIESVDLEDV